MLPIYRLIGRTLYIYSVTENQFSSSIPYVESPDQTDVSKDCQSQEEEDEEIEVPPEPRRCTRSTRCQPPEKVW